MKYFREAISFLNFMAGVFFLVSLVAEMSAHGGNLILPARAATETVDAASAIIMFATALVMVACGLLSMLTLIEREKANG